MAYDEVLAQRINDRLDGEAGLTSKKMFGGLGFMLDGHMALAAGSQGSLMVRADPGDAERWVDGETVNPMEMRGRPMAGWLLVAPGALVDDEQLQLWVDRGVAHVRTLPPKTPTPLTRSPVPHLDLPAWLTPAQVDTITALAKRNDAAHGDDLLGMVLTGSAARDCATERSDLDVMVVLTDEAAAARSTRKSTEVDEIVDSWSELLTIEPFGTEHWWQRWSYAWAPVLLDRTGGELAGAVRRQATLSPAEADGVLLEHDRLDGWVNFAYRALKNERDGRPLEARLDAAESVPWLLDVLFAIAGRVRPYNKYLPWELRRHPLDGWPADELLALVERTLDGDVGAVREAFSRVRAACAAHDARRGHSRTSDMIDGWGDELAVFEQA